MGTSTYIANHNIGYTGLVQRATLTGFLLSAGLCGLLVFTAHMPAPTPSAPRNAPAAFLPPRKHAPMPERPRPPRGTFLALVYAGNGQGEVEPCG
jgi:hypothetical protein